MMILGRFIPTDSRKYRHTRSVCVCVCVSVCFVNIFPVCDPVGAGPPQTPADTPPLFKGHVKKKWRSVQRYIPHWSKIDKSRRLDNKTQKCTVDLMRNRWTQLIKIRRHFSLASVGSNEKLFFSFVSRLIESRDLSHSSKRITGLAGHFCRVAHPLGPSNNDPAKPK